MELSPRFVDAPAIKLAGIEETYKYNDTAGIPEQWGRFAQHLGRIPGQVGGVCYGACYGCEQPGTFGYLASVEISSTDGLPKGLTVKELPASRYAVFTHTEHVSKLKDSMDAIWRQWFPTSGREYTGAPFFERYGEAFDPAAGTGDIEIWLPVKA